jgi:hypothetical protein
MSFEEHCKECKEKLGKKYEGSINGLMVGLFRPI